MLQLNYDNISTKRFFFSCTHVFSLPVWMSIRKNELELDYQNAFVNLEEKAKCNH